MFNVGGSGANSGGSRGNTTIAQDSDTLGGRKLRSDEATMNSRGISSLGMLREIYRSARGNRR